MQEWTQRAVIGGRSVTGAADRPVRIGHGVWIGDSVIVLPNVTIGNGAVIGAGSVVTRSIPSYAIAAGNPARVIRRRFPDAVVDLLEDVEWWAWTDEELRSHRDLFEADLTQTEVGAIAALLLRA
jgi:carbonic anhydrase/acetyltransferase-like protein (isoleucine patch superfamily)